MSPETLQTFADRIHQLRDDLFTEDAAGVSAEAEQYMGLAMADLSAAYHHLLLAKYAQMQALLAKPRF